MVKQGAEEASSVTAAAAECARACTHTPTHPPHPHCTTRAFLRLQQSHLAGLMSGTEGARAGQGGGGFEAQPRGKWVEPQSRGEGHPGAIREQGDVITAQAKPHRGASHKNMTSLNNQTNEQMNEQ